MSSALDRCIGFTLSIGSFFEIESPPRDIITVTGHCREWLRNNGKHSSYLAVGFCCSIVRLRWYKQSEDTSVSVKLARPKARRMSGKPRRKEPLTVVLNKYFIEAAMIAPASKKRGQEMIRRKKRSIQNI